MNRSHRSKPHPTTLAAHARDQKHAGVLGFVSVGLLILSSCAAPPVQHRDWTQYDGPGREAFLREELVVPVPADPLERYNRGVWGFNEGLARVAIAPLSALYRGILPSGVRHGVANAFNNLLFPVRGLNNVFQGNWAGAGRETKRFAVNTTVGVLGLWDRAKGMGIAASVEDTGQSLAHAGWKDSRYLVLPALGPSTIRDGTGRIGDALIDPLTYFAPASVVRSSTTLSQNLPELLRLDDSLYDTYRLSQFLSTLNRDVQLEDYDHIEDVCEACAGVETLAAAFVKPIDEKFADRGTTCLVPLPNGNKLPYTAWTQSGESSIVYIVPGLGSHRTGAMALALAELAYGNGFSVVTISSAMNSEFIEHGSTAEIPGFPVEDARDVAVALDAIRADMAERKSRPFTHTVLMGLSLGAFHTLAIAADEDREDATKPFDVYLAVNPPVEMEYALKQLDKRYNAPLELPEEQRLPMVEHTFKKVLSLGDGSLLPGGGIPFTELEASFLIGMAFRVTLQEIIFQTQERHDRGVLLTPAPSKRRASRYEEISRYSYLEYFYAFILPYYAERRSDITFDDAGAERLFAMSNLRSIEDKLKANERVHFMTNDNDFLLGGDDLDWMQRTFGDRAHHFPHGGHLGSLGSAIVRDEITEVISTCIDCLPGDEGHDQAPPIFPRPAAAQR